MPAALPLRFDFDNQTLRALVRRFGTAWFWPPPLPLCRRAACRSICLIWSDADIRPAVTAPIEKQN